MSDPSVSRGRQTDAQTGHCPDAPRRGKLTGSISEPPVTQQYLIGQFSVLLEDLQPPPGERLAAAVHDLRRRVESSPLAMLPDLAREAMDLTDVICLAAVERGDSQGFCRYAAGAFALGEFTDAAGLWPE
jgi:hypothetical protein